MDDHQIGLTRPEGRDRYRSKIDADVRRQRAPDVTNLWKSLREACPDIDIEDPRMLATFLEGLWVGAGLLQNYGEPIMQVILALIADGLDLVDALEAETPDYMT